MKLKLMLSVFIIAASSFGALAAAPPAHASPPVQVGTNEGASSLCMNRYHGGTATGTSVIGYNCGDTNNDFEYLYLTQACGGGTVTLTCPFTNTRLDSYWDGASIVAVEAYNEGLCVGSTDSASSAATLQKCPDAAGNGGGWSTRMVATKNASSAGELINIHFTNALGTFQDVDACQEGYRAPIGLANIGTQGQPSPACQWFERYS